MTRLTHWYDYITFNIYFLGLTTLSQTMGLVTPLLVQQFVGEAQKATYYGTFRLFTLMVALLAQALMGLFSDRSTLAWGRRRPFILFGTVMTAILTILIGFTAGMEGMGGFWVLFAIGLVQPVFSNMSQAAEQGIIPDLVPDDRRGLFSGVKALFEIPLPLILVAFTVGRLVAKNNFWAALLLAVGVLVFVMLVTMLVPEKSLKESPGPLDWQPLVRLLVMTVVFTLIILGMGQLVKLVSMLLENVTAPTMLFVVMGLFGLVGMLVAVALGVWVSVRISLAKSARENPSFTWWVINRLAFLVGAVNISTFAIYFLQARLGYVREAAAAPASKLILFVGVFILLSTLPAGWLTDRFGQKRMVAVAGSVAVVGTLIALSIPSLPVIYVGGCILGISLGLFYTANWALGTLLVPKEEAGRYLGISNLAGAGAGAVGAYIGGPIADFVTTQVPQVPGFGYVLLFSIYGLLFLFSVIALTQVKAQRSQPL
ncbi:MAG TPA: MFS transporter [Anaerolineales bacterium]|nr:MFS transporter [Anaerolineales bacterium]